MGVEYVSVLRPQLPKFCCWSSAMLATTAAEFGASGTSAGSGVFHGPPRANPLSGRAARCELPCWPASAGAAPTASVTAVAAIIDTNFAGMRM